MDKPVGGNLSASRCRQLIGELARLYFDDLAVAKRDGVPVELLDALESTSCLDVSRQAYEAIKRAENNKK